MRRATRYRPGKPPGPDRGSHRRQGTGSRARPSLRRPSFLLCRSDLLLKLKKALVLHDNRDFLRLYKRGKFQAGPASSPTPGGEGTRSCAGWASPPRRRWGRRPAQPGQTAHPRRLAGGGGPGPPGVGLRLRGPGPHLPGEDAGSGEGHDRAAAAPHRAGAAQRSREPPPPGGGPLHRAHPFLSEVPLPPEAGGPSCRFIPQLLRLRPHRHPPLRPHPGRPHGPLPRPAVQPPLPGRGGPRPPALLPAALRRLREDPDENPSTDLEEPEK